MLIFSSALLIILLVSVILVAAVAQLVETLRYRPAGRGFDSRLCQWIFSLA
jgi:hypothetical protein